MPGEYLASSAPTPADEMAAGATVNFRLDLLAPDDTAVSFEFEFI